jgi:hypothetical protein|tara:strand:- start:74 stop:334 length:261 start_codon:yes stop_codon:yes gene_type:complete
VSGTGLDSDLLMRDGLPTIEELFPRTATLCGNGNRRIVGQLLSSNSFLEKATGNEIRIVTLANAVVSLSDDKCERFYRRLKLRLAW